MIKITIGGIGDSDEFVQGFGLVSLAKKTYKGCVSYESHNKMKNQYWRWLANVNNLNGWHHKSKFIAWYECIFGGPKCLIGGIEAFSDYMAEEMGVRIRYSPKDMKRLTVNFQKIQKSSLIEESKILAVRRPRRVSIVHCGLSGFAVGLLARDILSNKSIATPEGIQLTLFNSSSLSFESAANLHDDLVGLPSQKNGIRDVRVVKKLKHAVKLCDLLIFMGCMAEGSKFSRLIDELRFNAKTWTQIGNTVNGLACNPEMRVVITCMKYPCFNATFFVHAAPKISKDSVVAVTHHLALPALSYLSKASNIPVRHMMQRTAYVWGSPDISHFVDLENTDFIYCRPILSLEVVKQMKQFSEEINWNKSWTAFDKLEFESDYTWRKMDYIVKQLENIWLFVGLEKERIKSWQNREPYIPGIRATMEILDHWYSPILPSVPISAGVYSTGIYGVPKGLVYSLPAMVRDDEHRGWHPFRWCQECRREKELDTRLRWNITPCSKQGCVSDVNSGSKCCHQRNPEIPLPNDDLLSLEEMVTTAVSLFHALDGTGDILSILVEPGETENFQIVDGNNSSFFRPNAFKTNELAQKRRQSKFEKAENIQKQILGKGYSVKLKAKPKNTLVEKMRRYELQKAGLTMVDSIPIKRDESTSDQTIIHSRSKIQVDSNLSSLSMKISSNPILSRIDVLSEKAVEEASREGDLESSATENEGVELEKETIETEEESELKHVEEQSASVVKSADELGFDFMKDWIPFQPKVAEEPTEQKLKVRLYSADVLSPELLPKGFDDPTKPKNEPLHKHRNEPSISELLNSEQASLAQSMATVALNLQRFGDEDDLPLPDYEHCNHPPEKHELRTKLTEKRRFSFVPDSGLKPPPKLDIGRFVSPERDVYEDNITYERRWAEARDKYDKMIYQDDKPSGKESADSNVPNAVENNQNVEDVDKEEVVPEENGDIEAI